MMLLADRTVALSYQLEASVSQSHIKTKDKEVPTTCLIKEGVLIPIPMHEQFAKVLRPFYILFSPIEEGYVATSPISDIYEQEASAGAATLSYLYSLADGLVWLQKQKESLSRPLLKQLDTIQSYLRIL